MMTTYVDTFVNIPKFDFKNDFYINDLKMWQFLTEVEKKKQGLLVWRSLPTNDVKHAINDVIGMDELSKDDCMDKLLQLLEKMFQQEKEITKGHERDREREKKSCGHSSRLFSSSKSGRVLKIILKR